MAAPELTSTEARIIDRVQCVKRALPDASYQDALAIVAAGLDEDRKAREEVQQRRALTAQQRIAEQAREDAAQREQAAVQARSANILVQFARAALTIHNTPGREAALSSAAQELVRVLPGLAKHTWVISRETLELRHMDGWVAGSWDFTTVAYLWEDAQSVSVVFQALTGGKVKL